jgi:hypothetical protein
MQETLDPINLTEEVKNRIIGWLVINEAFEDLKSADDARALEYHHTLGQWIRNRFIWKHYDENDNFVHPDDVSYEWILKVRDTIQEDFDIQEWKQNHPECLI